MNKYIKNLSRIEFLITFACTGQCKHCWEGEHSGSGEHIDAETAAKVVYDTVSKYEITSVMTFGGEPLLYPETLYAIHATATEMRIPKRQLITNGFFSNSSEKTRIVVARLAQCGVNDILLSVDAFHQETIPLEPVKEFAAEVKKCGLYLRVHPAWLISRKHNNPYNCRTHEILSEFEAMGILQSSGNVIIPRRNVLKYLSSYDENPQNIQSICIVPNGAALNGNIYQTTILEILEHYTP